MSEIQTDLRGAKILIVDDVPANLDVLYQTLEGENVHVQVATSGEKALEVVVHHPPDLILLDVMMPGIDGFETCRRLKEGKTTRDIPVIFLTALKDMDSVVEGFRVGGVDYMTKPFEKEEVLVRVRLYLEQVWLERELAEKNRELTDMNISLDEQVKARTAELELKARELENRDRIAQQLLKVPTLHQSLNIVLEGIAEVVDLDRAVIYLEEESDFKPAAVIGSFEPGVIVDQTQPDRFAPSPAFREGINRVRDYRKAVCIDAADGAGGSFVALIPILRDESVLGLMEVASSNPFEEGALQALSGFALQTAVAIIDARAGKRV